MPDVRTRGRRSVYRTARIGGGIDPIVLTEVREFLIRLTRSRKIDETPAALSETAGNVATAILAKADNVHLWANGSTRRVVLKRGWSEPAIVWVGMVGESGTTKTPPFKLVSS